MMLRYQCGYDVVGHLPRFSQEQIREELNLFDVTGDWVFEHGTPIVRAFVEALPEAWDALDFRVRCNLRWVKQGWMPRRSGFHVDQVDPREDGEQDHVNKAIPGKHTIAAFVGDCSRTVFVTGPLELPVYPNGQRQGCLHDAAIRAGIASGTVQTRQLEEGDLALFGEGDFHDASPATHDGWRYFMRATLHRNDRYGAASAGGIMHPRNTYEPRTAAEARLYVAYEKQTGR